MLITIDALRADTVGAFGGPPKVMPALTGLAREATWAGRAVSPSSWTVPSMASIFTGFQPWRVRSRANDGAVLDDRFVTLPESLKQAGYRTAAFRSNHWLDAQFGYAQGFDRFGYLREGGRAEGICRSSRGARTSSGSTSWRRTRRTSAAIRSSTVWTRSPPTCRSRSSPLDLEPYLDPRSSCRRSRRGSSARCTG